MLSNLESLHCHLLVFLLAVVHLAVTRDIKVTCRTNKELVINLDCGQFSTKHARTLNLPFCLSTDACVPVQQSAPSIPEEAKAAVSAGMVYCSNQPWSFFFALISVISDSDHYSSIIFIIMSWHVLNNQNHLLKNQSPCHHIVKWFNF